MYPSYRPQIKLEKTKLQKVMDGVGLFVFIIGVIVSVASLPFLPNEVPTHFNFAGEPDSWGSKYFVLALPIIGAVLFLGLQAVENKPHMHNYPDRLNEQNVHQFYKISVRTMNLTKNGCLVLFGFLMLEIVSSVMNGFSLFSAWMPMMIIFLLFFIAPIIWHLTSISKIQ